MGQSSSLQRTQVPHFPKAMGSITTAGTGVPTVNQRDGLASATRTNVGEFTLVLDEKAAFYNFAIRSVLFTTDAQRVFVKSNTPATRSVVLQVVNAGGA